MKIKMTLGISISLLIHGLFFLFYLRLFDPFQFKPTTSQGMDIAFNQEAAPATKSKPAATTSNSLAPPANLAVPNSRGGGNADKTNISTNGTGSESAPFDIRIVEYGHAAAFAIRENIVRPEAYRYLDVSFRAYVTLDRNMQFVKARIIQSTGSNEYDENIMSALRVTIYPPLPDGADWRQYNELDFKINNN